MAAPRSRIGQGSAAETSRGRSERYSRRQLRATDWGGIGRKRRQPVGWGGCNALKGRHGKNEAALMYIPPNVTGPRHLMGVIPNKKNRRRPEESSRGSSSRAPRAQAPRSISLVPAVLRLLATFLSGVAALNYELLWIRKLSLTAGSTQAAISCVLSVYFLGLALGNHLAGRVTHRLARPMRLYFGLELLIGLWGVLFGVLLSGLNPLYAALYQGLPPGSLWIHVLRITSAALLLLVPSTCMGATLPLLAQAGARELFAASRWSGLLYGVNTLGAMTGAALTGFVLIDRMGVSLPLVLTATLNVVCALCV